MTETDIEEITELFEREELPCEADHDPDSTIHDNGHGEWYVVLTCPDCGDADTFLVCWKFKYVLTMMGDTDIVFCKICNNEGLPLNDFNPRYEKRK